MAKLLTEQLAVVATIDPDAYGTGAQSSDWVAMSEFQDGVVFIVQVGDIASTGKVDFKVQEATSSGGAGAQDLTGKAITQLTEAGTDSDKQALVNVRPDELSAGFTHVKGILTLTTAGADAAVIALAGGPRYAPPTAFDLASVDEIVS